MWVIITALAVGCCIWLISGRRLRLLWNFCCGHRPRKVFTSKYAASRTSSRDYSQYTYTVYEWIFNVGAASGFLFAVGYFFYHNLWAAVILCSVGLFFPSLRRKQYREKRQKELQLQFKHALYALSSLLAAGKSVESAFQEMIDDLRMLYPDPETMIIQECIRINRRVDMGEPMESALQDFSRRAHLDDMTQFTQVFVICKRTGGDLIETVRKTAHMIADKIAVEQDISVMLAQKKLESKLLNIIPYVMIVFLSAGSPDYMSPIYHSTLGAVVMTVSIITLLGCYLLSMKLMNIQV